MEKIGVLLVNLGTPDKPEKDAVRQYLKEFLMDKRVINLIYPLRWILVNLIIIPKRLSSVTELYKEIWNSDSPIREILYQQVEKLQQVLDETLEQTFFVSPAMTYGQPTIQAALEKLLEQNVDRILVLPLFPQFSRTTTLAVKDRLDKAVKSLALSKPLTFIESYYQDDAYTQALVSQILERWEKLETLPETLLLSYHGIPKSYTEAGDPYVPQCRETTQKVQKALKKYPVNVIECFQSRVTREEWTQPYTDELLSSLATDGVSTVEVMCPGFAADCLETIDEIGVEYRELFLRENGESFFVYPALNARDEHVKLLKKVLLSRL